MAAQFFAEELFNSHFARPHFRRIGLVRVGPFVFLVPLLHRDRAMRLKLPGGLHHRPAKLLGRERQQFVGGKGAAPRHGERLACGGERGRGLAGFCAAGLRLRFERGKLRHRGGEIGVRLFQHGLRIGELLRCGFGLRLRVARVFLHGGDFRRRRIGPRFHGGRGRLDLGVVGQFRRGLGGFRRGFGERGGRGAFRGHRFLRRRQFSRASVRGGFERGEFRGRRGDVGAEPVGVLFRGEERRFRFRRRFA